MKNKIIIIIPIVILIILMGILLLNNNKYTNPIDITYDDFMKKIEKKESFVLFIYQTGCSHCEEFEIKLNDIIQDYDLEILSLNLQKLNETQYSKFKNKTFVDGTPTTVYFKDGKKANKLVGNKSKSKLKDFLIECKYIEEE